MGNGWRQSEALDGTYHDKILLIGFVYFHTFCYFVVLIMKDIEVNTNLYLACRLKSDVLKIKTS